jgi:hypothetical protein
MVDIDYLRSAWQEKRVSGEAVAVADGGRVPAHSKVVSAVEDTFVLCMAMV